ncbi:MAG: LlaJI family restriction endonuclease [Eubacterium sp.]|nr:LlaJI family restriction endonuclease [Eubacterium sp.]
MQETEIRSRCKINSNTERDTFVGLRCDDGDLGIHFPLGFHISEQNKDLRKDILLLFATLAANTERKDSEVIRSGSRFDDVEFPMQAYLYIVQDFLARGYYEEREFFYRTDRKGKINWNRTIKTQRPYIQGQDVFYLEFAAKNSVVKDSGLITLIHEYCVYESFDRIGWLFTGLMPRKPRIEKNAKLFRTVLREKLAHTFNDRNRSLFRNMLAVIDYQGDKNADKNYRYGTYRFEYVWEKMIDRVFGIGNKAIYFPKTAWNIKGEMRDNTPLKPDTIMEYDNNVYILDAKYYKYGITNKIGDLPGSESINKQITYGEYVAGEEKFKEKYGEGMKVFNAFLMPYDALESGYAQNREMRRIGEALGDWKDNSEPYHKIQGILIDVKSLMGIRIKRDMGEIKKLAELIEEPWMG